MIEFIYDSHQRFIDYLFEIKDEKYKQNIFYISRLSLILIKFYIKSVKSISTKAKIPLN